MISAGVLAQFVSPPTGPLTYTATRRKNGLLNIGPASANREVVILLTSNTGVNADAGTYLTINGVQAELDYLHGNYGKLGHLEIWRAVVPTGTDVQITSNNTSYIFDLSAFYSSEPIIPLSGSSSQVNIGATSATFTLPITQSGGSAIAGLTSFQDNFTVTSWDGIENLWNIGGTYEPGSGGTTVTDGNALTVTATLSSAALHAFKIGGAAYANVSDLVVTDMGQVAKGATITPPSAGGTFVMCFGRGHSNLAALSSVTLDGVACMEQAGNGDSARRAGAEIYTAPAVEGVVTWTTDDGAGGYAMNLYHVNKSLTKTFGSFTSPTTGTISIALTTAMPGQLLFGAAGITQAAGEWTYPTPYNSLTGGQGPSYTTTGFVSQAKTATFYTTQTNTAYVGIAVAAFTIGA